MDALTAHYSSPGRLVDYWRQFERVSWAPGTDPSIFAIELESASTAGPGSVYCPTSELYTPSTFGWRGA